MATENSGRMTLEEKLAEMKVLQDALRVVDDRGEALWHYDNTGPGLPKVTAQEREQCIADCKALTAALGAMIRQMRRECDEQFPRANA